MLVSLVNVKATTKVSFNLNFNEYLAWLSQRNASRDATVVGLCYKIFKQRRLVHFVSKGSLANVCIRAYNALDASNLPAVQFVV